MNTEKRIFDLFKWLMLVTFFLVIFTSCNPYDGLTTPAPTVTVTPTATEAAGTQTAAPTSTPARLCIVATGVPAGSLNIRTSAGVNFAVIGLLHEGQALTLTDESPRGNWIQITTGHVTGWINSNYCKIGE